LPIQKAPTPTTNNFREYPIPNLNFHPKIYCKFDKTQKKKKIKSIIHDLCTHTQIVLKTTRFPIVIWFSGLHIIYNMNEHMFLFSNIFKTEIEKHKKPPILFKTFTFWGIQN
jgi:hypothetical protein